MFWGVCVKSHKKSKIVDWDLNAFNSTILTVSIYTEINRNVFFAFILLFRKKSVILDVQNKVN